jgi:hypothetical protein
MSKLIRRTKKNFGAALLIALQMITLTLAGLLMPLAGGPQQSANAPADSQITADQTQTQTSQTQPVGALSAPPAGAIPATKLYEPRATEVFNLATSRAE